MMTLVNDHKGLPRCRHDPSHPETSASDREWPIVPCTPEIQEIELRSPNVGSLEYKDQYINEHACRF